jgi:hypothetical protein
MTVQPPWDFRGIILSVGSWGPVPPASLRPRESHPANPSLPETSGEYVPLASNQNEHAWVPNVHAR